MEPSRRIGARVKARAGELPLTQAADAPPAAFEALGIRKSVGLLTPYFPTADKRLRTFFGEFGLDVVRAVHLSCPGPVEIGHVSNAELIRSVREIDGDDIEAIVQFGANLPMVQIAAEAERWLGKPVLAVNAVTYWHALRTGGITDKMAGFGRLLADY